MPVNKKSRDRINCLLRLMKENRYPNYRMLVKEMRKQDLSGAYEVSAKTVQRDVAWLKEEYNAPIEYDASHKGYCFRNPYWEAYVPFLEESEMDAAIIGARLAEVILPPSKLRQDIREGTDALWSRNKGSQDESMVLSALVSNGTSARIDPKVFQTVFECWRVHRRLRIQYVRIKDDRASDMLIEPHVLTLFDNFWYLRARLLQSGTVPLKVPRFLNFALSRIRQAVDAPGTFEVEQSEIERVSKGYLFDMPRIPEVRLRVVKQALRYAEEYMQVSAREMQADGSCILTLNDIEAYRVSHFILNSGGDAVILSPPELIEHTVETAKRFIANQQSAGASRA